MGTTGYKHANVVRYRPNDVILEVGSGESTRWLATVGPLVVTIDVDEDVCAQMTSIPNVEVRHGVAEDVLADWNRPIGFAWLDGHDWPYVGNPAGYYDQQRASYERRGQPYSRDASRRAHLAATRLIASYVRVVAFDDTWQTHAYRSTGNRCVETVPPATSPASALALDRPTDALTCDLAVDHPHHDDPDRGWSGKGGSAVPYLLDRGFTITECGSGLVILSRH